MPPEAVAALEAALKAANAGTAAAEAALRLYAAHVELLEIKQRIESLNVRMAEHERIWKLFVTWAWKAGVILIIGLIAAKTLDLSLASLVNKIIK